MQESLLSARIRNRHLSIEEFDAGKVQLESLPRMLFVELTENCNLRCPMCRFSYTNLPEHNMPWPLFKRIADELFPTAEVVDLRGWGESTLHPDFMKYVNYALKFETELKIITNLSIPNQNLWRYLVRSGFTIGVSFDGATENSFEHLRKGARFRTVINNLKAILEEADSLGITNKLYLLCVAQGKNANELAQIVELAADLGIEMVKFSPIRTQMGDPNNLNIHAKIVESSLTEAFEVGIREGVNVEVTASLVEHGGWESASRRCIHPWMYCYINYKGEVGFCDHLIGPAMRQYLLGDLNVQRFVDIWNNDAFQALRREHLRWRRSLNSSFGDCNWCYANRFIDFEDQMHPAYARYRVSNSALSKPEEVGMLQNGIT